MSFTADEIWGYLPGDREKYVFTGEWYEGLFDLSSTEAMNDAFWDELLKVRGEVNKVIEQARAEYQKVAPQATRAREVAESVRNATTTRIAQEQAPALERIRALEQRAAELERIKRERQAQALREQQAEGEARLLVRDMQEMADSLRCGAPGWTEDGHQLQALHAPENKDALTMVEGLAD